MLATAECAAHRHFSIAVARARDHEEVFVVEKRLYSKKHVVLSRCLVMPSGGPRARKSDRVYHDIAADLATGAFKQCDIAQYYRVSETFVSTVATNCASYGGPIRPALALNGRPPLITYDIECGLHDLLDKYKTVQLDEVVDFVNDEYGVSISKNTASRALRRLNMTRKRVTNVHPNQDSGLRDDHLIERMQYSADQIVAVDESAADERTKDRKYGWSLRGLPCRVCQAGRRGQRWSILPAMTIDGYLMIDVYEGSYNATRFANFIDRLLPLMGRFPEPKLVILLDNVSSHWSAITRPDMIEKLEAAGVRLLWLPPYSPDFNPIEQLFNELKTWIRRNREIAYTYGEYFEGFIRHALEEVYPV